MPEIPLDDLLIEIGQLDGWGGAAEAKDIILKSVARFNDAPEKPNF